LYLLGFKALGEGFPFKEKTCLNGYSAARRRSHALSTKNVIMIAGGMPLSHFHTPAREADCSAT
jgi:hypothetical protein